MRKRFNFYLKNLPMQCNLSLTAVLLFSLFTSVASAQRSWETGQALSYSEGDYTMPYRLYLPADYDAAQEYPLVLFMHGAGARGVDNQTHVSSHIGGLINRTENDYPAILVAPQLPPGETRWGPENTYDLTLGILDLVQQAYSVDEDRLYLTGLSLGGGGTSRYAVAFPYLFAAIAPMSGVIDIPPSMGEPLSDIPTWLFHGNNDSVVNVSTSRNYYLDVTGETSVEFNDTVYGYPTVISEPIRYTELLSGESS
jgi:predicted peptidase